jgi:hypothetical protein
MVLFEVFGMKRGNYNFVVCFVFLLLIFLLTGCANEAVEIKDSEYKITTCGELEIARAGHTATLLKDGTVLVAGGFTQSYKDYNSAEIFDPKTCTSQLVGRMNAPRFWHTATLLPDGNVLLVGSDRLVGRNTAEIYDYRKRQFSALPNPNYKYLNHTATLLPDGRVLLVARKETKGPDNFFPGSPARKLNWSQPAGMEVFDYRTGTFKVAGETYNSRYEHTAVQKDDGNVLFLGGYDYTDLKDNIIEEIDATSLRSNRVGRLIIPRFLHASVMLSNGQILTTGGKENSNARPQKYLDGRVLKEAEVFNKETGESREVSPLNCARENHEMTLLPSGQVLVIGSGTCLADYSRDQKSYVELYDPETERFDVIGPLRYFRIELQSILIPDGRVLVIGGGISENKKVVEIIQKKELP